MTDHTKPDEATRQADRDALKAEHGASERPTQDEEAAADRMQDLDPGVAEHYQEMTEKGAEQKGEGRIP
jgi:hypothetical protein